MELLASHNFAARCHAALQAMGYCSVCREVEQEGVRLVRVISDFPSDHVDALRALVAREKHEPHNITRGMVMVEYFRLWGQG
jgi:hypothetical protein